MTRRRRTRLAVALLLLAAAASLPLPDAPAGDEATDVLAAASVWRDRDLRYDEGDLARGYRTWDGGPRGLTLVPLALADEPPAETGRPAGDAPARGTWAFGRPVLYPVLAAPFYGLAGPRGLRVLNMALFLAMVAAASWRLRAPRGCEPPAGTAPADGDRRLYRGPGASLLLWSFFFASAAFAWTFRLSSEVLLMASVFVSLALWCRVRIEPAWGRRELLPIAVAGALVAAAATSEPALALLGLPIAVDLLWSRRWKAIAAFLAAGLVAGAVLFGFQIRAADGWGPELEQTARTFAGPFPLEAVPAAEAEPAPPAAGGPAETNPVGKRLLWLLAGRHVGLLPYFPFGLFVLALYLVDLRRPAGRGRHLVAAALLAYGAVAVATFAETAAPGGAGAGAPGARSLALVYPALLFLPRRLRAPRGVLLPFAAAGLWTVPALAVVAGGAAPGYLLELPARGPAFRPLPLELKLLAAGRLPGYTAFDRFPAAQGGAWLVPRETFFTGQDLPRGVWVRGGSRSEVFVVSRGAVESIRFRARAVSPEAVLRVEGAGGRVIVRFDSEAKRAGTPVSFRPELVSRGAGWFLDEASAEERVYRFVLGVEGGAVPARLDPESAEGRYLGVFLELSGELRGLR